MSKNLSTFVFTEISTSVFRHLYCRPLRFDKKKALTIIERRAVVSLIVETVYEKGEVIREANQEGPADLYFLRQGMVDAEDVNVTYVMAPNLLDEESFVIATKTNNLTFTSSARLVAGGKCVIGVLPVADYMRTREKFVAKGHHALAAVAAVVEPQPLYDDGVAEEQERTAPPFSCGCAAF